MGGMPQTNVGGRARLHCRASSTHDRLRTISPYCPHSGRRSKVPVVFAATATYNASAPSIAEGTNSVEVPEPTSSMPGTGLPDVIWGVGRSAEQICASLKGLAQHQRVALATRIEPDMAQAVCELLPGAEYNACGRTLTLGANSTPSGRLLPKQPRLPGAVAIVLGSTADALIAEECRVVAEHLGCYVFRISDVSATGVQSIISNTQAMRAADVVIVVTGLDAALPSVVAGLVDAPVIAVPTSAGHSLATMAPLLSSLAPAAPGVTTVAIDNGLGAAVMATRMLRMASKLFNARMAASAAAAERSANGVGM